jgi:hypothetical protein
LNGLIPYLWDILRMKMKNYIIGLFSIAVLVASLQSCNEDIDITGDFEETAVVYGLIDQADSVHLIKITRAFIGPGNALEISTIPDSNYFETVQSTITEKINGSTARTWTLYDTIVAKDTDGIFYSPNQKLYAFKTGVHDNSNSPTGQPILANAIYHLNINVNNGEFTVSGETEVISDINSSQGQVTTHFNFAKGANTTGEFQTTGLNVTPGNSSLINATLVLNYKEFIGTAETDASVTWELGEREVDVADETFTMNGEIFYNIIAADCEDADPLIDKRNFESITLSIVGGSADLLNYILVNQPSSGLAQNKPTFTNLTASGDRKVVGLFSSRYTYERTIQFTDPSSQFVRCIDATSTQELCIGAITGAYLFCSHHVLDIPKVYYCN